MESCVRAEGWHLQRGSVSVAWVTDIGPREENQDRAASHIGVDGSWLIAVADGMGGQPRGREAAIAAIRGLPTRIGSAGEMHTGFAAANDEVAALTPDYLRFTRSDFHSCPAATLCAAARTPEGELLVGYAGDTMPVLLWHEDEGWRGRALGTPHRYRDGAIACYVGAPGVWPKEHDPERGRMDILTLKDIEPPSDDYAIAIMSDGVWEPIIRQAYQDREFPDDPLGPALAIAFGPDDHDANSLAHAIITAARTAGLDDNATVAVAAISGRIASNVS